MRKAMLCKEHFSSDIVYHFYKIRLFGKKLRQMGYLFREIPGDCKITLACLSFALKIFGRPGQFLRIRRCN